MEQLMDTLTEKMMDFDCGDPQRIQHFMKVHRFAQLIGHMEQVPPRIQYLVECAALVHDIGIHPAERKYGRCDGKLQEQEGPAYARAMLTELGLLPLLLNRRDSHSYVQSSSDYGCRILGIHPSLTPDVHSHHSTQVTD